MVDYKLIYFNFRGRAELIRLILHHQNVPFDDHRFEIQDWSKYKGDMMLGQVPVLEVDGQQLAQSTTIARYLARRHGLAGQTEWEQAQADMYVDCYNDLLTGIQPLLWEDDLAKRKDMFDKYHRESVKPYLEKLESRLKANGTGFIVGNSITWADLAHYAIFAPMCDMYGEQVLSTSPHLKQLIYHVANIPQIKKYLKTRPLTPR